MNKLVLKAAALVVLVAVLSVSLFGFSHMMGMGMNPTASCQSSPLDHAVCPASTASVVPAASDVSRVAALFVAGAPFALFLALISAAVVFFIHTRSYRSDGVIRYLAFLQHSPSA